MAASIQGGANNPSCNNILLTGDPNELRLIGLFRQLSEPEKRALVSAIQRHVVAPVLQLGRAAERELPRTIPVALCRPP